MRTLIVFLGCFINIQVASAQSFKGFQQQIRRVYENMTFSGVDLTVTNIPLINSPSGIAFAQFNPAQNKRFLLINGNYFYQRYRDKATNKLTPTGEDILLGAIAHEWAHHYMGHTLARSSVIKERNADIMAGRILYEYITRNRRLGEEIQKTDLDRALRVDTLFGTGGGLHLSRGFRRIMMRKGFILGLILDYKRNPDLAPKLKLALAEVQTQAIRQQLDSLQRVYIDSIISTAKSARFIRTASDTVAAKQLLDAIKLNQQNPLYALNDAITKLSQGSSNTALKAAKDIVSKKRNSYISHRDRLFPSIPFDSKSGKEINEDKVKADILTGPSTLEKEAIYNLAYLDSARGDWAKSYAMVLESLSIRDDSSRKAPTLTYQLQGNLVFTLRKNKQTVTLEYKGLQAVPAREPQNSTSFLYEFVFPLDKSHYFIDRHFHLWTDTIGARSIDNKIFLQTNHFYATSP